MKSSVCCTTQSKQSGFGGFLLLFFAFAIGSPLIAAQEPAADVTATQPPLFFPALSEAVISNSLDGKDLDGKDKLPYHLKLSFQIFDMSGKPQEEGTVDGWWAGADGSYLEVSSPSLGTLHGLYSGNPGDEKARRAIYLIQELVAAVRAPYGPPPKAGKPISFTKTEGKLKLDCMYVERDAVNSNDKHLTARTDEAKTIRLVSDPSTVIVRNRTGKFGPSRVALDVTLNLAGRQAITGKVVALESFKPSQSLVKLNKPSPISGNGPGSVTVDRGVIAGQIASKVNPTYPLIAREGHISGAVILEVRITTEGVIDQLTPIAAGDPSLTGAALDAVKQWKYRPYLLNGKPTVVNTTVTVNFNLNSRL